MTTAASPFPFHVRKHTIPAQHVREFARATARSQEDVLRIHVKQYVPVDNPTPAPGDVTLIGAHANGFPKELYEALWADLHRRAPAAGFRIRGIWIADVANQGYSGELNEAALGDDPCWLDHARDLLHLTNVFRAEMPRPLVGIGHSFGGCVLAQLALLHPRLLTTLVLLDPVIVRFTLSPGGTGKAPAQSSTYRRETWPSRRDAAESFRRSPFYRSWDPRVLDAWIEHAIRDTPTLLFPDTKTGGNGKEVVGATLRTTKHQEVFTFFRPLWPHVRPDGSVSREGAPDFPPDLRDQIVGPQPPFPFYRGEGPAVLRRLPELQPSVMWVFGGTSDVSTPESRRSILERCGTGGGGSGGAPEGRVDQVVFEGLGHLFPMEVPDRCADVTATWIGREMARWREKEREYEEWARRPMREKTTLSREYIEKVGPPPTRAKKGPVEGADTESKL
ncbi:putative toxin biosynthesis protein [Biscogniauxia marginata]|nr:putative toxin biosynthesis protein [Biscogniauxia marginata]